MFFQGTRYHLWPTVRASEPLLLLCPIGWYLPLHLAGKGLLQLADHSATWLKIHSDQLLHIFTQSKPIGKAHQDVQILFQPVRPRGGYKPVVHLEEFVQLLHRPTKPLWSRVLPIHHCHSVEDYRVHQHIQYSWIQLIALHDPPLAL